MANLRDARRVLQEALGAEQPQPKAIRHPDTYYRTGIQEVDDLLTYTIPSGTFTGLPNNTTLCTLQGPLSVVRHVAEGFAAQAPGPVQHLRLVPTATPEDHLRSIYTAVAPGLVIVDHIDDWRISDEHYASLWSRFAPPLTKRLDQMGCTMLLLTKRPKLPNALRFYAKASLRFGVIQQFAPDEPAEVTVEVTKAKTFPGMQTRTSFPLTLESP